MSEWGGHFEEPEDVDVEAILKDSSLEHTDKQEKLQKILIDSSQNGSSTVVHDLLSSSEAKTLVDIDGKDAAGSNALIYASVFGHENVVIELLRFGASRDAQDQNEWTALMWAIQNQHLGIVQRLVENGANVKLATAGGRTALDFAQPGTAIALYLTSQGHKLEGDDSNDFYKPMEDPADVEARFAQQLEESSAALGLQIADLSFNEDNDGTGLGFGVNVDIDFGEYDWERYHLEQSFVLNVRDIPKFLDLIVDDVKPVVQKNQTPVSANAIFMVTRYYHYNGPEDGLVNLLNPLPRRILKAVENHKHDLAYTVYWLVNSEVLLYYLRRDPGIAQATAADFQPTFEDLVNTLTRLVVSIAQELISPLIKPCLLDFENIPGISSIEYRGDWNIFTRHKKDEPDDTAKMILPPSMDALRKPAPRKVTAVLSSLLLVLDLFSVHPITNQEIFSQLLYWLGSTIFNAILGNRKYLARARAMQVRLNLSNIEDWARNNNRRPTDANEFAKTAAYKSMVELARSHLSSAAEVLQWLQIFSGFGTDFTNVVAAMQELKSLNPKQLLYAAKHYRVEKNEPALSKDYRVYLQELAVHYDAQQQEEAKKALEPKPVPAANPNGNSSEPTPEPTETSPTDGAAPAAEATVPIEPVEPAAKPVSISAQFKSITSKDIYLDADLTLELYVPCLREMVEFWGGGLGGVDRKSSHYFVPSISADLADALDSKESDIYDRVDAPEHTQQRWDEAEFEPELEQLPVTAEKPWELDGLDDPVWH